MHAPPPPPLFLLSIITHQEACKVVYDGLSGSLSSPAVSISRHCSRPAHSPGPKWYHALDCAQIAVKIHWQEPVPTFAPFPHQFQMFSCTFARFHPA